MEDYKKKYETAINQAKEELKACGDLNCNAARQIFRFFPELKESEDERIRKEIIRIFKGEISYTSKEDNEKYIAWLEKQKPTWSEEDEVMLDEIIDFFENGTVKLQHDLSLYASWLKSLKEIYTWKPSDEQLDALHDAAVYVDKSMFPYPKGILMKLYKQLLKLRKE